VAEVVDTSEGTKLSNKSVFMKKEKNQNVKEKNQGQKRNLLTKKTSLDQIS
jgi:hypothetical protein